MKIAPPQPQHWELGASPASPAWTRYGMVCPRDVELEQKYVSFSASQTTERCVLSCMLYNIYYIFDYYIINFSIIWANLKDNSTICASTHCLEMDHQALQHSNPAIPSANTQCRLHVQIAHYTYWLHACKHLTSILYLYISKIST